jgi:hypothetical protein
MTALWQPYALSRVLTHHEKREPLQVQEAVLCQLPETLLGYVDLPRGFSVWLCAEG